jgi:tetratricopeptide (TPR) repeat protein
MKKTFANLLIASCLASPAFAQSRAGEGPLDAARQLYASARYDEALAVLDGLRSSDRRSIEQYRSLCLLALGRTPEAEAAIAAVVTADPTFQPSEADASPRVRAAFTDVRQRLLPDIAGTYYAAAKATYDRKEWAAAERQFRDLLTLLNDRDMVGRLGDLRTLASGFLDLATAAAAPPPAPAKPEPAPAPAPAPVPQPPVNKVYGGEEPGVIPPVVIRQDIPPVPANITTQVKERGRLELVIDEQGRVSTLNVRLPIHPFYDQLIIGAAKDWRYKPATLNGVPVKYRKMIAITVAR